MPPAPRKRKTKAVVPAPPVEPWEKQPKESSKAFEAFVIYRDMGPRRSLRKTGRVLGESGAPTPQSTVDKWSSTHSWVERVDLYERELDRDRREAQAAAIEAARETESMLGQLLIRAAIRRLTGDTETSEMEATVIVPLDLNDVSAGEVSQLASTGTRILDRALGMGGGDLSGVTMVPAAAVYDLAQTFLALAVDALDQGMRAAVGANGELGDLIAEAQNKLIQEAGSIYSRTVR